ncbi:hypothetical protein AB9K21_00115 [Anaplasma phagocytophilum]|uniref:Putative p44-31 outer membrane protein, silent n=2 Tax=Anaplasma phagocytophilum TaxID=948 RepID=A0A0F3NJF0_ANAPH|nr:putative p44-17 outermembrane protein, silent [Anaplasma phagocytophilum str. ApMUC09]KJV67039.1 putative p44-31 outer membrane protein, silent [Anaplasma phagocytophilum str. ApNP]SCV64315.1 hypothetical protein ANAPH2_00916 [Anaplasma phagocytophilum]SCV65567.1 hypothetical protein ANAPH2_01306 [Anaplasma phagocytophilum]
MALCGGKGGTGGSGNAKVEVLKDFVRETLKEDGNGNWPTSKANGSSTLKSETNDNAKAVAKDLVEQLSSDEKTIVAGLLAKTIEGGEVVERCLSTST